MGEDGRVGILNEYLFGKETIINSLLTSRLDLWRTSLERLLLRREAGRGKAGEGKVWLVERKLICRLLRLRLGLRLRLVVMEETGVRGQGGRTEEA